MKYNDGDFEDVIAVMHLSNWLSETWQEGCKEALDFHGESTPTRAATETTAGMGNQHQLAAKQSTRPVKVLELSSFVYISKNMTTSNTWWTDIVKD